MKKNSVLFSFFVTLSFIALDPNLCCFAMKKRTNEQKILIALEEIKQRLHEEGKQLYLGIKHHKNPKKYLRSLSFNKTYLLIPAYKNAKNTYCNDTKIMKLICTEFQKRYFLMLNLTANYLELKLFGMFFLYPKFIVKSRSGYQNYNIPTQVKIKVNRIMINCTKSDNSLSDKKSTKYTSRRRRRLRSCDCLPKKKVTRKELRTICDRYFNLYLLYKVSTQTTPFSKENFYDMSALLSLIYMSFVLSDKNLFNELLPNNKNNKFQKENICSDFLIMLFGSFCNPPLYL
jgi:hypothetical protein